MQFKGTHLASYLAVAAIIAILIRLVFAKSSRQKTTNRWMVYVGSLFAGIVVVNGLVHFLHGASGEDFPAPLGFLFTSGFLKHLSNVVWGFINIALGYYLIVKSDVFKYPRRTIAFFTGVFLMGVILCYIFS